MSTFWHTNLAPGTIPEYTGVSLGLNDKTVERLWFGYDEACPDEYYIVTSSIAKRIKDLQIEDVKALGMVLNRDPTFGDTAYCMGIAPFKSYCEFKNNLLITFQARHSEFKFSKSPDGPFFSLPIAFDEYQKMFGKPLRWKREVSGKRVP